MKQRAKARKKAHRRAKRAEQAAGQRATASARRPPKLLALRALLRGQPVLVNVSLTDNSSFSPSGTTDATVFPVASTGYVGARYQPTAMELGMRSLDDFISQGYTIVEWDGR